MGPYSETLEALGKRVRALRILLNLQQREVAARAGVSLGLVARLEHTGNASLENVLRVAMVLGAEGPFEELFAAPKYRSLDEALSRPRQRQRVRRGK